MKHVGKIHWIVVSAAIVLIVLLYLAPSKHTSEVARQIALDAKVKEAIRIVQTQPQPMEGIMLLREVIDEDPENRSALLFLGIFSCQSGQFDKAVPRLEKLLALEPEHEDGLFWLSVAYTRLGEKEKAIAGFEKFDAMADNEELKAAARKYIEELKNS